MGTFLLNQVYGICYAVTKHNWTKNAKGRNMDVGVDWKKSRIGKDPSFYTQMGIFRWNQVSLHGQIQGEFQGWNPLKRKERRKKERKKEEDLIEK